MILGKFPASLIPLVAFFSACYFISQYLHHERPFPDTWISATADHYPEFIFFRIGTISGPVFFIMSFVLEYFWICQTAIQNGIYIRKYRPEIGAILGIAAAMFLMGSTANLDTGINNGDWHVFCAGNYFLWTIFSVWYYTYISLILYRQSKAGNKASLIAKIIMSLLILLQIYLKIISAKNSVQANLHNRLSNIIQYTAAFSILSYFLILAYDLKNFKMAYIVKR